jgi:hypothetical protein
MLISGKPIIKIRKAHAKFSEFLNTPSLIAIGSKKVYEAHIETFSSNENFH